jgi:hypothetical protein
MASGGRDRLREQGLWPFQADFLLDFLRPDAPAYWELASPAGSGKAHLAVTLVERVLVSGPSTRVLILVPKALVSQWTNRLGTLKGQATVVALDRPKLLELQSTATDAGLGWPVRSIVVISIDFARRPDVADALTSGAWDLVIADESHLLAGKRAEAFYSLLHAGSAKRALLLTATPTGGGTLGPTSVERRLVTAASIVNWDGTPLYSQRPLKLETIPYERRQEEFALMKGLESLAATLTSTHLPPFGFLADALLRTASSSLFAVEGQLRRVARVLLHIRNTIAHGVSLTLEDFAEGEGFTADDAKEVGDHAVSKVTAALPRLDSEATRLMVLLEELPGDSKLEALSRHLKGSVESESRAVCVWTGLSASARYLAGALESPSRHTYALTADLPFADRAGQLAQFRETGGLLVTTGAALEDDGLEFVEECIHYDLPSTGAALEQRFGRFLRFGRTLPFVARILRDQRQGLLWEEELIRKLLSANAV